MPALGLIETRGLLAAIEGADVMLKSADVTLLEKNLAGGGLVTITVAGDVSAVQAAVEAAEERICRISKADLVSVHVIPRPDNTLESILLLDPEARTQSSSGNANGKDCPEDSPNSETPSAGKADSPKAEDAVETSAPCPMPPMDESIPSAMPSEARLRRMSLSSLRTMALHMDNLPMEQEAIASANKKSLIAVLKQAIRNSEE